MTYFIQALNAAEVTAADGWLSVSYLGAGPTGPSFPDPLFVRIDDISTFHAFEPPRPVDDVSSTRALLCLKNGHTVAIDGGRGDHDIANTVIDLLLREATKETP